MFQAAIKTIAMVTLSVAAFMASPMAFPFVLITIFLIWATPFAIAAFLQRDDEEEALERSTDVASPKTEQPWHAAVDVTGAPAPKPAG